MEAEQSYIAIRGCGAISPLGHTEDLTSEAYLSGSPAFSTIEHANQPTPVAALSAVASQELDFLIASNPAYRQLDRSVLMGIYTTRQAAEQAGWLTGIQNDNLAVNIGSSRGATGLFEQHYSSYVNDPSRHVAASVSPTTTLGNVSSWAAHAVNAGGAQISHSITCSTALVAVANAVAWLKAGMAQRFLAGGTEAPLTPFTIAQMKAIGIYSGTAAELYPCKPYNTQKQNTFVLGEGAAVLALEKVAIQQLQANDVIVEAIGFGFEPIQSKTGITADGQNFQQAMRQALSQFPEGDSKIDLIITHTPGTVAGDKAELAAIKAVFSSEQPALTTNKWLLGHTLGASGALSVAYALHILKHQKVAQIPYTTNLPATPIPSSIKRIMINAAGFGGNAASLVIKQF